MAANFIKSLNHLTSLFKTADLFKNEANVLMNDSRQLKSWQVKKLLMCKHHTTHICDTKLLFFLLHNFHTWSGFDCELLLKHYRIRIHGTSNLFVSASIEHISLILVKPSANVHIIFGLRSTRSCVFFYSLCKCQYSIW